MPQCQANLHDRQLPVPTIGADAALMSACRARNKAKPSFQDGHGVQARRAGRPQCSGVGYASAPGASGVGLVGLADQPPADRHPFLNPWPAPLRGVHVRGHRPRTVGAQVLEHLCLRSTVATVSTVSPLPFGPPLFRRIAHSGQASRVRSARFSPGPCASLRAAASEPALAPCPPIALHASRRLQRAEINETKDEGKP